MASFACPQCGTKYAFREGMAGRKVKCAQCGATFVVAAAPAAAPSTPGASPVASHIAAGVLPPIAAPGGGPMPPQAMMFQGVPMGIPVGLPPTTPFGVPANAPAAVTGIPTGVPVGTPFGAPAMPGSPYGVPGQPAAFPGSVPSGLDSLLAADAGVAGPMTPGGAGPLASFQPIRYRRKAKIPWLLIGLGCGGGAVVALLGYLVMVIASGIGNSSARGTGGAGGGGTRGLFGAMANNTREGDQLIRDLTRVMQDMVVALRNIRDPQSMQQGVVRLRSLVDEFERLLQKAVEQEKRGVQVSPDAAGRWMQDAQTIGAQLAQESLRIRMIPGAEQLRPEMERLAGAGKRFEAMRRP